MKASTQAVVKVGDQIWLDSSHVKVAVPYKLTARWSGPFVVLETKGAQVTLNLPATFGKAHRRVNVRRLKFFEARDAQIGTADQLPRPLPGVDGSDNSWVLRQILLEDVPALLAAYEAKPDNFKPRTSAPIQATKTKVAHKGVGPVGGRVIQSAHVLPGGAAIQAKVVASP